ncbi:MAG: hypothetical protein K0R29_2545 [Pseudobdellovibrio sp.]|jgi:hypothetical protein|nr:hypothetical protein [Pseudobdellovibrio sp.]
MKLFTFFAVVAATLSVFADTYKCTGTVFPDKKTKKELWSANFVLPGENTGDSVVFDDNGPVNLKKILEGKPVKGHIEEFVSKEMKPYNGKVIIGLTNTDNILKLSQGVVNTEAEKDKAGAEAISWTDVSVKKIGVKNMKSGLQIECIKQ